MSASNNNKQCSVSCMKLPADFFTGNITSYYETNETIKLPTTYGWLAKKAGWEESTVGNKFYKNTIINNNVRSSFIKSGCIPGFNVHNRLNISKTLSKIYPEFVLDNFRENFPKLGQSNDVSLKNIAPYFFPDPSSLYYGNTMDLFDVLLYTVGGHFREHTDSSGNRKFATTLIFPPQDNNLKGGDLILRVSPREVNDPDKLLFKGKDRVVLSVNNIKDYTVLITFHVSVPHSVNEVQQGYRYCLKTSQYLPKYTEYFNNRCKPIYMNPEVLKHKTLVKNKEHELKQLYTKIREAKLELAMLRHKNVKVEDLTKEADHIVKSIDKSNEKFHLVVLKTGPKTNDYETIKTLNIKDNFGPLSIEEIDLYITLWRKYPFSPIKTVWGTRMFDTSEHEDVFGYSRHGMLKSSILDCKIREMKLGEIDFSESFDGKSVLCLHQPDYSVVGHQADSVSEYNDQGYDCTQYIVCYGIFVR